MPLHIGHILRKAADMESLDLFGQTDGGRKIHAGKPGCLCVHFIGICVLDCLFRYFRELDSVSILEL